MKEKLRAIFDSFDKLPTLDKISFVIAVIALVVSISR